MDSNWKYFLELKKKEQREMKLLYSHQMNVFKQNESRNFNKFLFIKSSR